MGIKVDLPLKISNFELSFNKLILLCYYNPHRSYSYNTFIRLVQKWFIILSKRSISCDCIWKFIKRRVWKYERNLKIYFDLFILCLLSKINQNINKSLDVEKRGKINYVMVNTFDKAFHNIVLSMSFFMKARFSGF